MDLETLSRDIQQKLDALGQQVSADTIAAIVKAQFDELIGDEEFARKIRFGPGGSDVSPIAGSKYARMGLSVGDVEFLYALMASQRGVKTKNGPHPGPSPELERTFRSLRHVALVSDEQALAQDERELEELFANAPISYFLGRDRSLAAQGRWHATEAYRKAAEAVRAMDTAETGFGSQLVGNQYVNELWAAAASEQRIWALINAFPMDAGTAFLPVEVDFPEMLFVAENTANNASNYGTSKTGSQRVQVDAKKFVIHQMWSGEMEEDSIIPYLRFLRGQAEKSIAFHSDSLALNGDTTNAATGNINLDDADPADTKHYLAFDGIRHAALVDNTGNAVDAAGAVTVALLNAQRGKMLDATNKVDWGHPTNRADLIHACDPETADRIGGLAELITVDKYGPNATILTGETGRVLGSPVIPTMAVSKTEADGKVSTTGANNTKGQVVTFNRNGFAAGIRRRLKVVAEEIPATDQKRIVYSMRVGFGRFTPSGAASGIEAATVLYDVTL